MARALLRRRRVHRGLRRHAARGGRGARRQGPLQEGPRAASSRTSPASTRPTSRRSSPRSTSTPARRRPRSRRARSWTSCARRGCSGRPLTLAAFCAIISGALIALRKRAPHDRTDFRWRPAAGRARHRSDRCRSWAPSTPISALLAERAGFRAIYLSGAGVANASFGLPDLGITSLNDVCEDVRRITSASDLPLLVDADTGWGAAFNISRTIADLVRSGAAGCHLEDQVQAKRCGHRPGKALVSRGGDGRPHQGRRRRPHRRQLRDHGAHRRARRRGPAGRHRARAALRRGRRRHDLRRGAHRRSTSTGSSRPR